MILYALVARAKDGVVLVDSSAKDAEGNQVQISSELLEKIKPPCGPVSTDGTVNENAIIDVELLPDGGRKTFVQRKNVDSSIGDYISGWTCMGHMILMVDVESELDNDTSNEIEIKDYYVHLYREDSIICLCISSDTDIRQHALNFDFLNVAKSKFLKQYSSRRISGANVNGMNKYFRSELGKLIQAHNKNRSTMVTNDKNVDSLSSLSDLKGILGHNNLQIVIKKDRKQGALVKKNSDTKRSSKIFAKQNLKMRSPSEKLKKWMMAMAVMSRRLFGNAFSNCEGKPKLKNQNDFFCFAAQ